MSTSRLINLVITNMSGYSGAKLNSELNQWFSSCLDVALDSIDLNKKKFQQYDRFFSMLPKISAEIKVDTGVINFEKSSVLEHQAELSPKLKNCIMQLIPWRKGPFKLFGIPIDTEWDCSFKWNRLIDKIPTIQGDAILDIGSGNGYFAWRMRAAGAGLVVCLDPGFIPLVQFQFLSHFSNDANIRFIPISLEDSPKGGRLFDKIFMMGTLYHSKAPFDHLKDASSLLKQNGFLVLETLIHKSDQNCLFVPQEKYARMPNVWHIPSVSAVKSWLIRLGYSDIDLISVDKTTENEQRATEYMPFESLGNGLHEADNGLTIEMYPRPIRAIFVAQLTRE